MRPENPGFYWFRWSDTDVFEIVQVRFHSHIVLVYAGIEWGSAYRVDNSREEQWGGEIILTPPESEEV